MIQAHIQIFVYCPTNIDEKEKFNSHFYVVTERIFISPCHSVLSVTEINGIKIEMHIKVNTIWQRVSLGLYRCELLTIGCGGLRWLIRGSCVHAYLPYLPYVSMCQLIRSSSNQSGFSDGMWGARSRANAHIGRVAWTSNNTHKRADGLLLDIGWGRGIANRDVNDNDVLGKLSIETETKQFVQLGPRVVRLGQWRKKNGYSLRQFSQRFLQMLLKNEKAMRSNSIGGTTTEKIHIAHKCSFIGVFFSFFLLRRKAEGEKWKLMKWNWKKEKRSERNR